MEFVPLRRADFPLLGEWLSAPHVEPWWREPYDQASIEARYGPCIDGTDPTEVFVIHRDGDPIGLVQRYLIDDNPAWKKALAAASAPEPGVGIDFLIGDEALIGHGIGPMTIGRFLEDTWLRYPASAAVIVAVDQTEPALVARPREVRFRRSWSGTLDSDDPSDQGPCYVYVLLRRSN